MATPVPTRIKRLRAELDAIALEMHNTPPSRGFDSQRRRDELHREWDAKYDMMRWLEHVVQIGRDGKPEASA